MQLQLSILATACAFVLGLVMGSFLNCWARRIVYGESIVRGRSHCTSCNHALAASDLVPVLSWFALHGRCRYCGARISIRYLLAELGCAVVYASIVFRYGVTLETVELLCFASALVVLFLTDLDVYLIPNGCILVAIAVRACYLIAAGALGRVAIPDAAVESLIGGVAVLLPVLAVVLITDKLLGRPSMGGGDLKLMFTAGLYFGWQQGLVLIAISCIFGLVSAVLGARLQGEEGDARLLKTIPFGPSIALACWVVMLFGSDLLALYWS